MKTTLTLLTAAVLGLLVTGCDTQTTTKKVEVTTESPSGETKHTVEQKTETTDDSTTRTTTEKVEKSGENPPPANP